MQAMADANQMSKERGGAGQTRVAPYTSFKTFLTFLQDLKDHSVPNQIDRSVLKRFSGSVGTQLQSALKFLQLTSADGTVLPQLQQIVSLYGTESWPNGLKLLIEGAYEPIVSQDLKGMTPQQFHDAFRTEYGAKDAVLRKCEVFFLQAAKAADIQINPRIAKTRMPIGNQAPRRPPEAKERVKAADTKKETIDDNPPPAPIHRDAAKIVFNLLDEAVMSDEEQDAVWILLRYLRRHGVTA